MCAGTAAKDRGGGSTAGVQAAAHLPGHQQVCAQLTHDCTASACVALLVNLLQFCILYHQCLGLQQVMDNVAHQCMGLQQVMGNGAYQHDRIIKRSCTTRLRCMASVRQLCMNSSYSSELHQS